MSATADILVVEDDPTISRLLHDIFTLAGGSVRLAATADAAAASINEARPTLMTLDLNLPDQSGQALLERLRDQPELQELPVIVITSQLPIDHKVRAMAAAVVEKPFDLDELLAAVSRVAPKTIRLAA
jgi:Response regulator containing CheY-like receiver, AAA-type ATPase, and DNA-binding domains